MLELNEENRLLDEVIRLLEKLRYDTVLDSMEPSWVRSVLVEVGPARHNLLVWVHSQLCPTEAEELQASLKQTHFQKILESFTSLGICKPGDSGLIQGTAPPLDQLKFWRGCLHKVWQVHHVSSLGHSQKDSIICDRFLDHLANSKHLSVIQKDSGANVIPGHLREKYRANYKYVKSIPHDSILLEAEENLKELQDRYSTVDKKWKNQPLITKDGGGLQQQQETLCESVSCLIKQQDLFQGVYSTNISPWTKSSSQLELPDTGPVIHEATTKLSNLTAVLNSMEDVSRKSWELAEQGKELTKHRNRPSTITSMLQGIVTHEQNAKSTVIPKA
ncbi:uncharacterized protein [Palaemon carinicauda]|uniref:uncharacterized protein isoform X1 n=1 Tax=Palaemon carinicauda TaxID=392227 RepID=UPI0035B67BB0